jgi:Asp-tRNA(Asn)/Glu-tRNA(Gln) amidotransferase A subunit family amidase
MDISIMIKHFEAIRRGETDLLASISGLCDRIDAEEDRIHALVADTYSRDRLLADAAILLARYSDPSARPPFFGIPVGIKDIFRVDGFPTRCGSKLPPELFEGVESTCVSRLRQAGAIIVGKTVTTEFAYFEPGPTANPRNLEHTPGGSSSGSASGVAAGFFPVALGTQTIGSIIRPAAYCGIVGFKPSFGRIATDGVIPFSPSADHVGLLLADLSLIEVAMALLDDRWKTAQSAQTSKMPFLGVPDGPYLEQATERGRALFERALQRLREAGCAIRRFNPFEDLEAVTRNHRSMIAAEFARVHARWFEDYRELYRGRTIALIETGLEVGDVKLEQLRSRRLELRDVLAHQMDLEGIELWVCPSASDSAPKGLGSTGDPAMNLPWTHAGLPAISLPAGVDETRLPHGIQCVGRFMQDESLAAAAASIRARLQSHDAV